jgi:hypothetical protein
LGQRARGAAEPDPRSILPLRGGARFPMKHLSVVGNGYNIDEKNVDFYNVGQRIKFLGKRRAITS